MSVAFDPAFTSLTQLSQQLSLAMRLRDIMLHIDRYSESIGRCISVEQEFRNDYGVDDESQEDDGEEDKEQDDDEDDDAESDHAKHKAQTKGQPKERPRHLTQGILDDCLDSLKQASTVHTSFAMRELDLNGSLNTVDPTPLSMQVLGKHYSLMDLDYEEETSDDEEETSSQTKSAAQTGHINVKSVTEWYYYANSSGYGNLTSMTTDYDPHVRSARELNGVPAQNSDVAEASQATSQAIPVQVQVSDGLLISLAKLWTSRMTDPDVRVQLYKMNLYRQGDHFAPHRDTPELGLLGTIVLCVFRQQEDSNTENSNGMVSSVTSSQASSHRKRQKQRQEAGENRLEVNGHLYELKAGMGVMFYSDVPHCVKPILDRLRITLTFKVFAVSEQSEQQQPEQSEQSCQQAEGQADQEMKDLTSVVQQDITSAVVSQDVPSELPAGIPPGHVDLLSIVPNQDAAPCQYGLQCRRLNPQHLKEHTHPHGHVPGKPQMGHPIAVDHIAQVPATISTRRLIKRLDAVTDQLKQSVNQTFGLLFRHQYSPGETSFKGIDGQVMYILRSMQESLEQKSEQGSEIISETMSSLSKQRPQSIKLHVGPVVVTFSATIPVNARAYCNQAEVYPLFTKKTYAALFGTKLPSATPSSNSNPYLTLSDKLVSLDMVIPFYRVGRGDSDVVDQQDTPKCDYTGNESRDGDLSSIYVHQAVVVEFVNAA